MPASQPVIVTREASNEVRIGDSSLLSYCLPRVLLGLLSALALFISRPASAQTLAYLDVIQDNHLWEVATWDGTFSQVGTETFSSATSMTGDAPFYVIDQGKLWSLDLDGTRTQLGTDDWSGATNMDAGSDASGLGKLFVTQESRLWSVTPSTGALTQLGGVDWAGATSLAFGIVSGTRYLYIIQDSRLWRVNPGSGAFTQLGGPDWGGPTRMTFDFDTANLYLVQDSALWRANPSTGAFTQLGSSVWSGATSMVAPGGPGAGLGLFIIQNSTIYHVDSSNGAFTAITGPDFGGATQMTSRTVHI